MEHIWTAALIILYFGHNFTWAENTNYFVVGKVIELRPPPGTTNITGILWKHNDNLAAEWAENDPDVEYYGSFNGRAVLTPTTGLLVIKPATEADGGVYTVQINNRVLDDKYEFASVQEVPTPRVWVKPGEAEEERTLSCEGDVSKAGPVTFWWDITEDRSWVMLDRRITLKKNETTERMEWVSCKMANPAGEKESERHENPFFGLTSCFRRLQTLSCK
ncbi:uncharacterized protein [Eucyclogobius newberryi]|uniref:uncharacterized protein n=1 Tax=Eucyclogobius newberryi TaxID=166745 RepID=UPI003B58C35D